MRHMREIYRAARAALKPGTRVKEKKTGTICIVGNRVGNSANVRFWLMTESPPHKKGLEHAGILMNSDRWEILEE